MRLSEKGAAFTRAHEGYVGRWYLDPVGIPTIGIGFTWRSTSFRRWWKKNKPGVEFKRGATISRKEAENALRYLFDEEYGAAVNQAFPKGLKQNQFDSAGSITFNVGPRVLGWKWAQALKKGDVKRSANLMKSTAVTAQGKRLRGLMRRRSEEAKLLQFGVYTGLEHQHDPIDAMADGMLERGEAGPDVAELILNLATMKYYDGAMDDIFGHGTQAAVTEFQRDRSITANGKVGPQTFGEIKDALAEDWVNPNRLPSEVTPKAKVTFGEYLPEKSTYSKPTPTKNSFWQIIKMFLKGYKK